MKTIFVTSFGKEYYERVAQYTLPYLTKASRNHELYVYYENEITLTRDISLPHVSYFNLYHCSPLMMKFLSEIKDKPQMQGKLYCEEQAHLWLPAQKTHNYNYKLNAFLFCRKLYALLHAYKIAATRNEQFVLVWIDADVLAHDYFDDIDNYYHEMFKDDQRIAYLARDFIHSECGLMFFKSSSIAKDLLDWACELYSSHQIFELEEWHDSYAFDELRKGLDDKYFYKLALGSYGEDVFTKSFFNKYAIHLKGANKRNVEDIINERLGKKTKESA